MRTVRFSVITLCVVLCLTVIGLSAAADRPTERVSPAPETNPNAVVWRTPDPPKDPQAGDVWVNPKDSMEMVYVAPGEFILGTSDAQIDAWLKEYPDDKREWFADEQPQCRANLPGYWIGRTEVTNAQYLAFVQATGHYALLVHWKDGKPPAGLECFPVVYVNWVSARAYCEWAGGRLPSELEWEKAARGADGRLFPWSNQWDSKRCRNFELITGQKYATLDECVNAGIRWRKAHDVVREGPAAAGSYPGDASTYCCLDMTGNVSEWCGDWYDATAYQRYAGGDLTPPAGEDFKVLRGGPWNAGNPWNFRCANRVGLTPVLCNNLIGFRCARGLP